MVAKKNSCRIVMRKPEGKRLLRRPRRRWVVKQFLEMVWDGMVWTGSIWLRIGTSGGLF
jgi:hypothetical protein